MHKQTPCCTLNALLAALAAAALQVMPASHIFLLYLINSLLQTFLTANT
jgi:hypothetical protein